MRAERGDIVLGWLTKVVAILAFCGLAVFDGLSIGAAHFAAADQANEAAQAGRDSWQASHNIQQAYNAAVDDAETHDDTIAAKSFSVDTNGTVHLTLTRHATTLLLRHIGPLKHYADVTADGSAAATP